MAWLITLGHLQLGGTGWISSSPTHDQLFIHIHDREFQCRDIFVLHSFPAPSKEHNFSTIMMGLNSKSMMRCLGVLLIEVMLGGPIQTLVSVDGHAPTQNPEELLSDVSVARNLLDRVDMKAGRRYTEAVRQCISRAFREDSFSDTAAQNILAEIASLLEEDIKLSNIE